MRRSLLLSLIFIGLVSTVYSQSKPRVMLVATESDPNYTSDVVNKLNATGSFSTVFLYDARTATPTVGDLQSYDVVLVWSNVGFFESTVLGDNLATYIEGGGHVINMVFALYNPPIGGAFATNYELIKSGSGISGAAAMGTIIEPLHPLINNINTFSGGTSSFRSNGTVVNGTVIAEWDDGLPLIVAQENVGPAGSRRVDLNFWPVSSDAYPSNWVATGQGTEIMENAIIWVMDSFRKVTIGEIATDIGQSYDANWADYDNDGFQDLFVPNRNATNSDKLYHNNGDGTFTAVVAGDLGSSTDISFGGSWADYDNDGDQDLFVAIGGISISSPNKLYQNNGDGTFSSMSAGDLTSDALGSTGGAWADFDNDGFLDLAVANSSAAVSLYRNNGDGTFSLNANFTPADVGALWGPAWGDFNGDGKPDLYVANNGGANFLYQNNGGGFFTKITTGLHVTDITSNVGASWVDIDNDGDEDIFVPVYGANNKLYINNGAGVFTSNLVSTIVTETSNSRSASWGDFNNDGKIDLYIGNEFGPGSLFRNDGNTNFTKITSTIVAKDKPVNGSGSLASAWCDFDNDGDLDLFTSVYNGENNFYINEINNGNNWIDIKLEGTDSNRSAVGAQIRLTNENDETISQTLTTQNGRGQSSINAHFGLDFANLKNISIIWPSGLAQSVKASPNQFITIIEGSVDDRPTVLALGAEGDDKYAFDVRDKLIETGEFSIVKLFRANDATPDLAKLQSYDATLVWSQFGFLDPVVIGDNLADYIDGGGAVVSAVFANASIPIQGRFSPDYELIAPLSQASGTQLTLGIIPIPEHPIMNNVSSFDGGTSSFRSSSTTLTTGSQVVAEWSDGSPLIVIKEGVGTSNAKRVDLNFWVTSSDAFSGNWVSSTDGARIMANALLWAVSPLDQFTKMAPGSVINSDMNNSWGNAWGDYDGDGNLDLFVGNQGETNLLYKNNGNNTFVKNITDPSVTPVNQTFTPSWGDYNNDGALDLFVPDNGGNNILYKNNGSGILVEAINFGDTDQSTTGAWGDFDGDGYLDLFVGNFGNNKLFRNNQDGTFTEIIDLEIIESQAPSYGASWGDYDNDGFLDLFITEWGDPNILLHNNGDNTFSRITSGEIVSDTYRTLGGSWGDYDNDSDLDLFVSNHGASNALYQNNGDGTFTNVADQANIIDAGFYTTGSSWVDYDNDGYLDLFIATDFEQNNILLHNNGDATFTTIKLWAPTIDAIESFGASWADYDKDGDVDLFVSTIDSGKPNLFYTNNGNANNWINIVLEGVESNKSAIGAKIYISTSEGTQLRELASQTGFASQNSINAEFGLSSATIIDNIEINWPSGRDQLLKNVDINQFITIVEDVVVPTIDSEVFPAYFDLNGSAQQASITVSDDQSIGFVEVIALGISQPNTAGQTIMATTSDGVTFNFDLSFIKSINDPLGASYQFVVYDNAGNTTMSSIGVTHIEFNGEVSPTIPNLKFGATTADYQIISFPFDLNDKSVSGVFEDDLGAYDITKWRLYQYRAGSTTELPSGNLEHGKGYWFIARSSSTIDTGVGSVPQSTKNTPYQLTLTSGWNQIGNPYNFNISWSEILAFNGNPAGVDTELTLFESGFVTSDVLDKFRGAFVNANSNITLNIPVIKNNAIQGRKVENIAIQEPIDSDNWRVKLNLKGDNLVYQLGGFGMNKNALLKKDNNDLYTAPRFIEYLEMNFDRDGYTGSSITRDIVPTKDNFVWDFTVNSNLEGQQLVLEWDNSYWGDSEKQLILFDEISNTRIDMRKQTDYKYTFASSRKFQLIFGDANFIDENLKPKNITINNAFPNPFSDHLSIPVGLPTISGYYQIRLDVYDQIGRIISENTFDEMAPGYHIIEWNGSNNQGSRAKKGIYYIHVVITNGTNSENYSQRIYLN